MRGTRERVKRSGKIPSSRKGTARAKKLREARRAARRQTAKRRQEHDGSFGGDGDGYKWTDPTWKNPYTPPWAGHQA